MSSSATFTWPRHDRCLAPPARIGGSIVGVMVVLFTASLTLLGVASAQAIPFTTSGLVSVGIVGGGGGSSETVPPNAAFVARYLCASHLLFPRGVDAA